MQNLGSWTEKKKPSFFVRVAILLAIILIATNIGSSGSYSIIGSSHNATSSLSNPTLWPSLVYPEDCSTAPYFANFSLTPYSYSSFPSAGNPIGGSKLFYYTSEPAPMGIVDYGLSTPISSGTFSTYSYSTPEFLGNVMINSLLTQGNKSVGNSMEFQLNTILVFNNLGEQYDYWIQDIAILQTTSNEVSFLNNIWNSSWPGSNIYVSTLSGNGTIFGSNNAVSYYTANSQLPGSGVELNFPTTFSLEIASFETHSGQPEVSFRYCDGNGWQTFDTVIFKFARTTSDRGFVVDGNGQTPARQDYDAELVLGGPGSGHSTTDVSSNVSLQLDFWNGHNLQAIRNAFDFGSDTLETISNISVSAEHFASNGSLFVELSNGEGQLAEIYDQENTSSLTISGLLTQGKVTIGEETYSFVNGRITLSLWPGSYHVRVSTSFLDILTQWNTTVILKPGGALSISPPAFSTVYMPVIVLLVVTIVISIVISVAVTKRLKK
jgi:hypothetical protein